MVRLFILSVFMTIVLVACGGGGDDRLELPESITTVRETFGTTTVRYPLGWVAEISNEGIIHLSTGADVLASFNQQGIQPLQGGQQLMVVVGIPQGFMGDNVTLQGHIQSYTEFLTNTDASMLISLGNTQSFKTGEVNSGTLINDNGSVSVAVMAANVDGGNAIIFGMSSSEQLNELIELMKTMSLTVKVTSSQ